MQSLQSQVHIEPNDPLHWLWHQGERCEDPRQTIGVFRKMLELARHRDDIKLYAHVRLAKIFEQQREFKKFKEHFFAAILIDPDNPELRFQLGRVLFTMGRRREAAILLRAACDRAPENPHYHAEHA